MIIKNIIVFFTTFTLSILSSSAHAQFGGLLDNLKKQAEQITQINKTEIPTKPSLNSGNTKETIPTKADNPSNLAKDSSSNAFTPNTNTAFACKIEGKQLVYTKNLDSDDPNISVNFNLVDVTSNESDFRTTFKEPIMLSINEGNRQTITSYYFQVKQITYAISHCEGMQCGNPSQPYWFTVFENNKKIKQDDCEDNTATDFKFPIITEKNGIIKTQDKNVLIIKKSNLKFDPFN
jgi:hypothetical protein